MTQSINMPWLSVINEHFGNEKYVETRDIFTRLDITPTKSHADQVGKVMRILGYKYGKWRSVRGWIQMDELVPKTDAQIQMALDNRSEDPKMPTRTMQKTLTAWLSFINTAFKGTLYISTDQILNKARIRLDHRTNTHRRKVGKIMRELGYPHENRKWVIGIKDADKMDTAAFEIVRKSILSKPKKAQPQYSIALSRLRSKYKASEVKFRVGERKTIIIYGDGKEYNLFHRQTDTANVLVERAEGIIAKNYPKIEENRLGENDPWYSMVLDKVCKQGTYDKYVITDELLKYLDVLAGTKSERNRIGKILRDMGYHYGNRGRGRYKRRLWVRK